MLYQVAQIILLRIAVINLLDVVGGLYKSIKAFFPLAIWITGYLRQRPAATLLMVLQMDSFTAGQNAVASSEVYNACR